MSEILEPENDQELNSQGFGPLRHNGYKIENTSKFINSGLIYDKLTDHLVEKGIITALELKLLNELLEEENQPFTIQIRQDRILPIQLLNIRGKEMDLEELLGLETSYYIYKLKLSYTPHRSTYLYTPKKYIEGFALIEKLSKVATEDGLIQYNTYPSQLVYDQIINNVYSGLISREDLTTWMVGSRIDGYRSSLLIKGLERKRLEICSQFNPRQQHTESLVEAMNDFMFVQDMINEVSAYKSVYNSSENIIKSFDPLSIASFIPDLLDRNDADRKRLFLPLEIIPYIPLIYTEYFNYLTIYKNLLYDVNSNVHFRGALDFDQILYDYSKDGKNKEAKMRAMVRELIRRNMYRKDWMEILAKLEPEFNQNSNNLDLIYKEFHRNSVIVNIETPSKKSRWYMRPLHEHRPKVTSRFHNMDRES